MTHVASPADPSSFHARLADAAAAALARSPADAAIAALQALWRCDPAWFGLIGALLYWLWW
jgi:hypothetical protein